MKRFPKLIRRTITWVAAVWHERLTLPGKCTVGGAFLAMFASVGVYSPVFQLAPTLIVFLVISLLAGAIRFPRVTVSGAFPATATAGHRVRGRFKLTNVGRRNAYDIEVATFQLLPNVTREPGRSIPVLEPGESVTVTIELSLEKRGLFPLGNVVAYSTFPFNLMRFGRGRQKLGSMLVLPSFHPLAQLDLPRGLRFQPGGVAMSSHVGESQEYIGSREYIYGESTRWMDHRAWARLGKPAVREFQDEYFSRVAVVMDSFDSRARNGDTDPLEAAVSLTASLAEFLSRGESLIDILAAGPETYVLESGRHVNPLNRMLEILACIETCRVLPYERLAPELADHFTRISSTVCVFLDWDEPRRQLAHAVLESGCHLKLILLRDGDTTEPVNDSEFVDALFLRPHDVLEGKVDEL